MTVKKEKTVYALGFFDGVHLGHQALLRECRSLADKLGLKAAAVTFDRHPGSLISGHAPVLINGICDREMLLRSFGMDRVIVLPFDERMMQTPWQEFLADLLRSHGAAGLVCGDDFHFGKRGEGNARLLQEACAAAKIPCVVVPEQTVDGIRVSSTHIRKLLEEGELEAANRFLGHPHVLSGKVISGRQLGRTIGIPTANLQIPEGVIVPKFGVYACKALAEGKQYLAVTNVGMRPTVGGSHVTVEPWLLDFEGDLYGKELTLQFYSFLRPEEKFPSLEELKQQIVRDAERVKEILQS